MRTSLVELVADAAQVLPPTGAGIEAERVAGIPCVRYDIDQAWATQANLMHAPDPVALDAAIGWLRQRAARWTVTTRAAYASDQIFAERGLAPTLELTCLALTDRSDLSTPPAPAGLEVGLAHDPDEFLAIFGTDLRALVSPALFEDPSHRYLVGRLDGTPVACARVLFAAGTAYVSGIVVAEAYRGRGIGAAISAAAARQGFERDPRAVWLTATDHVRPLYTRLGFRPFDVHVQLRGGR